MLQINDPNSFTFNKKLEISSKVPCVFVKNLYFKLSFLANVVCILYFFEWF